LKDGFTEMAEFDRLKDVFIGNGDEIRFVIVIVFLAIAVLCRSSKFKSGKTSRKEGNKK